MSSSQSVYLKQSYSKVLLSFRKPITHELVDSNILSQVALWAFVYTLKHGSTKWKANLVHDYGKLYRVKINFLFLKKGLGLGWNRVTNFSDFTSPSSYQTLSRALSDGRLNVYEAYF